MQTANPKSRCRDAAATALAAAGDSASYSRSTEVMGDSSSSGVGGASTGGSGWCSQRGGNEDFSSPIPYREGPLEYEPAMLCHCRRKAAKWISWSDDNPGRRYYKCFYARVGGCEFWQWIDHYTYATQFVKDVLKDLRDTVRGLKKENREMASAIVEERSKVQKLVSEIDGLKKFVADKDDQIEDLMVDVKKFRKAAMALKLVLVVLVGVVLGMWFSQSGRNFSK